MVNRMSCCREQRWQTMVDCNEDTRAKQQPTKILVASLEQATIAKKWYHQRDDQLLCPMLYCKKLQQWWWWLIAMSAQDCLSSNLPYDWCGSTTSTIARCKVPAIILIARTQWQRQQCNNHFLSCCKEQWQQQTNAREEHNNSHATINLSCFCLQNVTMTIPHHTMTSGASMPRSSTVSMPKTACTLPKASTVSMPNGMYVLEGKYSKYAWEATFVKKSNNEPLATSASNHVHHARRQ